MSRISILLIFVAIHLTLAGKVANGQSTPPGRTRAVRVGHEVHDHPKHKHQQFQKERSPQRRLSKQPRNTPNARMLKVAEASFHAKTEALRSSEMVSVSEGVLGHQCPSCLATSEVGHVMPTHRRQTWAGAEYLLWWTKGMETPALATTSPAGTSQQDAGILGGVGTSVLFGADELIDDARSGGRFSLGMGLDPCQSQALEFTYTALGEETDRFSASSSDFSILARPFVNAQTGSSDARLISFPGQLQGALSIEASSEFQTAEVLLRRTTRRTRCWQLDVLWGYRFADIDDMVRVSDSSSALSGPTAGATLEIFDAFASENQFHGGQFGIHYVGAMRGCWSLDVLAKVALGNSRFRGTVSGVTTATDATGNTNTVPAGLLALDSNVGTYEEDTFSTIAEFGISLKRHLNCGVTATIGYTLLGWSDVLRAGEQIDDTLNLSQVPPGTLTGASRPRFPFDTTSFWAQGLSVGLEWAF